MRRSRTAKLWVPACLALTCGLSGTPARAEGLSWAELDGARLEATVTREQTGIYEGRQVHNRISQAWTIELGPGAKISLKTLTKRVTPDGRGPERKSEGSYTLGEMRSIGIGGGGQAAFEFREGVLTFVRTYQQGAYRATFEVKREKDGLACTMNEVFAREGGAGQILMNSMFNGKPFRLINSRQLSSTCRASKRQG